MKMKKSFNIFLVFLIMFFTVPFGGLKVSADAGDNSRVIPDKAYEIDYVVKHETKDEESSANSFFNKPANLLYSKDGEKYIQLTVKSWSMIEWLRTEHGNVIVVNDDNNSALIQFKVDGDLSDVISLNMFVNVPGMYSKEHDARLILKPSTEKEVNAGEFRIIPGTEDNENGPIDESENGTGDKDDNENNEKEESDESTVQLENGSYNLGVTYLQSDSDDSSSMGRYLADTVFVTVKDDKVEVTI